MAVDKISPRGAMPALLRALLCVLLPLLLPLGEGAQGQIEERGPRSDGPTTSNLRYTLPGGGDPFGIVQSLSNRGIELRLSYMTDVLGNVQGGQRRGWVNQGLLEPSLQVDFERLAGITGLKGYLNGFFIHNTGRIRRDYVGGVNTIGAIEAMPRIRLSEVWLEQSLLDGAIRLRAGQLAADVEFLFSDLSTMFLQSDFPTISALNLPGGGPAFPLATPGAMVAVRPSAGFDLSAAIFDGNTGPPQRGVDDQVRSRYNTNFRVLDPALLFAEARWRRNQEPNAPGLARTLKLGGWGHLGRFEDLRFSVDGSLLANPASSGVPLRRRGTWGLYGILDQQLWRPEGGDALSGISVFGRVTIAPQDRSTIGFYADGGIVFANLVPGRPHDRFGVGFVFAQYAQAARDFDRDVARLSDGPSPRRNFEANLELTYLAEIHPGFDLQPVVTHIWNPSETPGGRNALVVGFRTRILY
ncbi:carbohydrate porin [Roseococcus pinisoli]|uniref:Carbohydrate porin n=1 Tax=Roseococcus pinisoli TaxID=2835040 RepID=A0ABS5QGT1_9PROT|nr:carbohydrate porin [Roseococcus pinisoli]